MTQQPDSTTELSTEDPATKQSEDTDPRTVGIISDVHGNHTALQTVLDDMPAVDAIIHAGDTVGYGPQPNACTEVLRQRDVYAVKGNHDMSMFDTVTYESGGAHAETVLSDTNRSWLRSLPTDRHLWDSQLRVAHGHPDNPLRYVYPDEFNSSLLNGENMLVLGHTHVQAAEQFETGWIINPGSVGQPRDSDSRAAYAVADLAAGEVTLHRVSYDIDAVAERIRARPISQGNATRLYDGQ